MANQIPEPIIEEVKKTNDIVDVIGEYIQLKKQGKNYFGLCPFHGENTPSFSVTQDKQIFHCFGCGKGGNVFSFLMEMENFTFYEALKYLADRSGVELPTASIPKETSLSEETEQMLSAYEWLTKLYHHLIKYQKDGKDGLEYLKSRGLTKETLEEFQIGYAPDKRDFTAKFLIQKGYSKPLLLKSGILAGNDNNEVIDRFRGRIIFPIRNALGRTVGFGGRAMHDDSGPKYLNSSEGELFQKSKLLYNFDLAKRHIRKENEAVLMEGYMDVISVYQAGVKNVVATMGTALTETQAKLLNRYVDTVIICFDGDSAGIEARYKSALLLRSVGCDVRIANLDAEEDPDSYVREHGGEAFKERVLRTSDSYMSFFMRYQRRHFNLQLESERIEYIERVLKELSMIESALEREYYIQELHKEFDLSVDTLMSQLAQYQKSQPSAKDNQRDKSYTKPYVPANKKKLFPAYVNAEKRILSYMLQDAYIAEKVQYELGAGFNVNDHKIVATHLYAFYEEGNSPDISLFMERLSDEHLKNQVIELAMSSDVQHSTEEEIDDYLRMIHREADQSPAKKSLKEQQRKAEQENDPLEAARLAMELIRLQKQNNEK
ncbi:DNA primase [Oceanobacillus oncorhynchi]|uniref:DNA primase n=1 Tax=Oceanobacillus oncorhynchi TaxID=545501 RepID=A0A0A1MZJ4_9BACI|nr:DNA primase [Oceanobacillus oncorhynchi]CEI84166.1 DNA primase [Oceanobacillus oncorhynchi]